MAHLGRTSKAPRSGAKPVDPRFDLTAAACATVAVLCLVLVPGVAHQRELSRFLCAGLITTALVLTTFPKLCREHQGSGISKLGIGLTLGLVALPLAFVLNGLDVRAGLAVKVCLAWAGFIAVVLATMALARAWQSRPKPSGVFYLPDEQAIQRARRPRPIIWDP